MNEKDVCADPRGVENLVITKGNSEERVGLHVQESSARARRAVSISYQRPKAHSRLPGSGFDCTPVWCLFRIAYGFFYLLI